MLHHKSSPQTLVSEVSQCAREVFILLPTRRVFKYDGVRQKLFHGHWLVEHERKLASFCN